MHADELSGRETSLLGQLKQAYLDGDVPMAGVQLPDLIPHSIPVPRIRPQPSAVRDEIGHVIVQLGHRLIERGKPGTAGPGELGQVSVGYLAMADDPLHGNASVLDIVGPEFVPRVGGGPAENCLRGGGRLAFTDESRRMRLPWVMGQVAKFPLLLTNHFSAATW